MLAAGTGYPALLSLHGSLKFLATFLGSLADSFAGLFGALADFLANLLGALSDIVYHRTGGVTRALGAVLYALLLGGCEGQRRKNQRDRAGERA
jgi:hypothetical protein